ncbi:ABC transporter ATP-binding protein [Roseiarcaceae bacterium H3SJ34-1]|uniref:ABC transporter ATP-binding protein n=1 Tax=Terripilifer ovatus TaxID=3032367 RepID=UPI003AB9B924|nr:ABC transporter ATP-binding protein [Roseiarcaceae bacterium H3SJ34-1]
MSDLLDVAGLNAAYGASQVLHDIALRMSAGEVILLLGRNGAGKTTLMKALMGLVSLRGGSIRLNGTDIAGKQSYEIARLGIGLVPEDRRMFAHLTVAENLQLGAKPGADGRTGWNFERVFQLFPDLRNLQGRKAGNLSGGQQQMVAVARTLLGNPDLVLLDEPGEGLAPVIVEQMANQLGVLRREGLSMIISEQNLSFARKLADRAYILESGYIRHSGTLAELDANPDAWTRYIAF